MNQTNISLSTVIDKNRPIAVTAPNARRFKSPDADGNTFKQPFIVITNTTNIHNKRSTSPPQ